MTKHSGLEYLYRCQSQGQLNNGLKQGCNFEFRFPAGSHHCPLCGSGLEEVSDGPSVSELLRRGQQEVDRQKKDTK